MTPLVIVTVALPCARVPVALGMKMTVSGTESVEVPERSGVRESVLLSPETLKAAPQGMPFGVPAGPGVSRRKPPWHWYKNAYVPFVGGLYFHEMVKGVPEGAVAGAETVMTFAEVREKREENQLPEIVPRLMRPQITTVMIMMKPMIARILESRLAFGSSYTVRVVACVVFSTCCVSAIRGYNSYIDTVNLSRVGGERGSLTVQSL